jgi:hypothetical protein
MFQSLDTPAIEQQTRLLLRRAGVKGTFPTPVDEIVAAAGLTIPEESMFSESIIEQAPEYLRRAIRKLTGPVQALLDRKVKEVHIDPSITNQGRTAFLKLHEATHQILPWQRDLAFADDAATLSSTARALQEQEANLGASNLLFQHEAFDDVSHQFKTGMATVLELAQLVGASAHATFRRYVRVHDGIAAGVVLDLSPCSRDPLAYNRHEVDVSKKWNEQFGSSYWPKVLRTEPYSFVAVAEQARASSGAVRSDFVYPTLQNVPVTLNAEVYSNQHRLFVLIWKPRRELLRRGRIIAA